MDEINEIIVKFQNPSIEIAKIRTVSSRKWHEIDEIESILNQLRPKNSTNSMNFD